MKSLKGLRSFAGGAGIALFAAAGCSSTTATPRS